MQQRRIVGIDLGVATSQTAHVVDDDVRLEVVIEPTGLYPVVLPATAEAAELDRRVRAAARLTDQIGTHKRRLIELTRTDLAVLERYGDPRRLAVVRTDRLAGLIVSDHLHLDNDARLVGLGGSLVMSHMARLLAEPP